MISALLDHNVINNLAPKMSNPYLNVFLSMTKDKISLSNSLIIYRYFSQPPR